MFEVAAYKQFCAIAFRKEPSAQARFPKRAQRERVCAKAQLWRGSLHSPATPCAFRRKAARIAMEIHTGPCGRRPHLRQTLGARIRAPLAALPRVAGGRGPRARPPPPHKPPPPRRGAPPRRRGPPGGGGRAPPPPPPHAPEQGRRRPQTHGPDAASRGVTGLPSDACGANGPQTRSRLRWPRGWRRPAS